MSNTETVPVELTCTGGVEILSAREVPLSGTRAMCRARSEVGATFQPELRGPHWPYRVGRCHV